MEDDITDVRCLVSAATPGLEREGLPQTSADDQHKMEETLRFLAGLIERLRPLTDLEDVLWTVVEAIGAYLDVSRCFYSEVDPEREIAVVHRNYCNGVASITGTFPLISLGKEMIDPLQRGQQVVNEDTAADPRTAPLYETVYAPAQIRSFVGVPLMQNGRCVAHLVVHHREPRRWRAEEISLLQQVIEQTSRAVQNAHLQRDLQRRIHEFETLFEILPVAVFIADDVTCSHIRTNAAAKQLLAAGKTEAPMDGMASTFTAYRHGVEIAPAHLPLELAARTGKEIRDTEFDVLWSNGAVRSLIAAATPLFDARGAVRGSVGIAQDITGRKNIEEDLRHSEEQFRSLAAASPVGIFHTDVEGRCLYTNSRWQEIAGLTLQESLGDGWKKAIHPDDRERVFTEWQRCMREQIEFLMEFRFQRPDGETRWVRARAVAVTATSGEVIGYVGIDDDITEIRQAAEEQARLLAILEATPDFVGTGLPDGSLNYHNRAFRELQAISEEQVKARNNAQNHTASSLQNLRNVAIPTAIREGKWVGESTFVGHDGHEVPVSQVLIAHKDEEGHLLYLSTIARDVSREKAASEQLIEANRQLENQIQRVAEQSVQLETQKNELERANCRLEEMNARLGVLASTDGLTGLKNHRAFQERLGEEVDRAARYNSPLSLVFLDIDAFKSYNDTFGHPAGDAALQRVAKALQGAARITDTAARYGGEEFAIILTETDAFSAKAAAERFRAAVEEASWQERPITASFGVATLTPGTCDAPALIASADKALYQSKRRGRNCVTHIEDIIYSLDVDAEVLRHFVPMLRQMRAWKDEDGAEETSEAVDEHMRRSYEAMVKSWSRLIEMRDGETQGHSERVNKMITQLAHSVGMSEEEVVYARWGALLHDVGKVGVPDAILYKAGPLTPEERDIMQRHPIIAHEMLSPIPFLFGPALEIPRYHHEKWDGSGYPMGLTGESIPLAARLFAVVDVYDALRSERPYRKAWPDADARDYLRAHAGAHFDPEAVNTFLTTISSA